MSFRDDVLKSYFGPRESMSASIDYVITTASSANVNLGQYVVYYQDKIKMNQEARPYLYRATVVDSRDHQIIPVEEFIAAGDDTARIIAWSMAAAKESLDVGVLEFYDIVLQRLGQVRPKRDAD